ncbi:hypothetical protein [Paenibacillus alba]|uniref:N-acetyltransferase domain-containing protein n=1 Tax=Paenibacillus alba TaxID=1197127 RepID=A0ABU6GES0_9BACL|nr:hypothetical protein [Paenibacillus alba]MEC0232715.1 hypothetical protein [Paenibacillus alba]
MNISIKTSFELRLFKSSKDKDFAEALKIYSRNIPASIRTDTNEITYWLNNYNKVFTDKKLYLFGLYYDDIIVGFSEMVYIKSTKIYIIDYLVIDKSYRKNGLFQSFAYNLERFVESEPVQFDYVLTEIGFMNNSKEPVNESKALIRLLKTGGFDVIKAPYKQPLLGSNNYESLINGQLLIWAHSNPQSLNKSTYMSFIRSIYFDHYLEWYKSILTSDEISEYEGHLNSLYKDINKEIKKSVIEVNGYHLDPNAKGVLPPATVDTNEQYKAVRGFAFLTLFIALVLIFTMKLLSFSMTDVIPVVLISLFIILAFVSIYSKNAMKVFNKVGDLLKFFSRRSK